MVKFYIKNHEFWYKVHQTSPNIQFYKNRTSYGCISGYIELGKHSKYTKPTLGTSWVLTTSRLTCGPHQSEREKKESLGMKKAIIKCAQTMKSVLCGVHYHTYGSYRPRANKNMVDLNQIPTQRFRPLRFAHAWFTWTTTKTSIRILYAELI